MRQVHRGRPDRRRGTARDGGVRERRRRQPSCRRRSGHPYGRDVRRVRVQGRSTSEYMAAQPEHRDHRADHQDRGPPQEPRRAPRHQHRRRRHRGASRRAGSASSRRSPDKFNNLIDFGAADIKSAVAGVEVEASASSTDGQVIGLGTDVGGMAMCYRTRPVREGGPADRPRRGLEAVADLGGVHRDRQEVRGRQGAGRRPSSTARRSCTASILGQAPIGIYDGDNVVVDTNPAVKKALGPDRRGDQRRAVGRRSRRGRRTGTPASRRARSPRSPARRG